MEKTDMYKVVYCDGMLRLKDKDGTFIPFEKELIINSSVDDAKDMVEVTVTLMADISELKK